MKKTDIISDNKGMTMVEVLMGFMILSIILGGVTGLISFSSKMFKQSVDLRRAQTDLTAQAYKTNTGSSESIAVYEVDDDGNDIGTSTVKYKDETGVTKELLYTADTYTVTTTFQGTDLDGVEMKLFVTE